MSVNGTTHAYIFVASRVETGSQVAYARDIAKRLLENHVWLFSDRAPHVQRMTAGDKVLVYLAGPGERVFIATAVLAEPMREASEREKHYLKDLGLTWFTRAVTIKDVRWFDNAVEIAPLVPDLAFIGNKKYYGHYLRQAVAKIPGEDYERVVAAAER